MKRFLRHIPLTLASLLPTGASAQWLPTVETLYENIQALLQNVIGVLMVLAGAVFAWGVISYLMAGPDEKKVVDARKYMVFGIITLAVMLSAWTLAYLFLDTFGIF
ncbi:MAG: hypothetical protein AAB343_03120 [Patescibacteria group bacterium]